MAKQPKKDDDVLDDKKRGKSQTIRQQIEKAQESSVAAVDKPARKAADKSKTSKTDTKKVKKQIDDEPKSVAGAFWWGFLLPLRWIWKGLRIILWPLVWVLKRIIPPYFKNSWKELKLVTWPTNRATFGLTFAVLMFAIVFGAIIAGVDFGLDKVFKALILK